MELDIISIKKYWFDIDFISLAQRMPFVQEVFQMTAIIRVMGYIYLETPSITLGKYTVISSEIILIICTLFRCCNNEF